MKYIHVSKARKCGLFYTPKNYFHISHK